MNVIELKEVKKIAIETLAKLKEKSFPFNPGDKVERFNPSLKLYYLTHSNGYLNPNIQIRI